MDLEKNEELSIPGTAVMELLRAVHEKGAALRFKAAGSSMTPSICNHDVITVSPLEEISPFVGEVVAFRHPRTGRLLVHRVVRKKQGTFDIRGDSLRYTDSHIPRENILGVVTAVERRGRGLFWPDRFRHPFWARLYFRGYLAYTEMRFHLKAALRLIFKK
jgi:ribosomal protein L35AE/L33A